jgi:glycosyltransferase involved in cell wall biosynthesis
LVLKLLTCIVTYNRLEYTQNTVESWLRSVRLSKDFREDRIVVVDNGSTDGTLKYLEDVREAFGVPHIKNNRNLFPGAATNIGWHAGMKIFGKPDLLHRSDNDVEYLPGWREEVEEKFEQMPTLGQLGLLNAIEDYGENPPWEKRWGLYLCPTGGNCVIRRELWDEGLRWEPGEWRPGGRDEDTLMSESIRSMGYLVGRVVKTVATNQSFHRFEAYPEYYRETAARRGLVAETSV